MAEHYYNEFNPDAAQWLRNLMGAGHIPRGDVDTRSIEDVTPNDVAHYTQCHWFAGIGGWPLALRLAGWPDSRPVWTGSCPCQPFSAAGKGAGFSDERHLWPAWLHLIRQCRPSDIIGEQVASPDALRWFDLVSSDLEGSHYASAAADLCSAGIGAPHIRQRLYWMAYAENQRIRKPGKLGAPQAFGVREVPGEGHGDAITGSGGASGWMGQPNIAGPQPRQPSAQAAGYGRATESAGADAVGVGDGQQQGLEGHAGHGDHGHESGRQYAQQVGPVAAASDATVWLPCLDGKSRPASAEPGAFPLAYGIPRDLGRVRPELARMGRSAGRNRRVRLHGYGNAIDPRLAAEFVGVVMEVMEAHNAQRRAA